MESQTPISLNKKIIMIIISISAFFTILGIILLLIEWNSNRKITDPQVQKSTHLTVIGLSMSLLSFTVLISFVIVLHTGPIPLYRIYNGGIYY